MATKKCTEKFLTKKYNVLHPHVCNWRNAVEMLSREGTMETKHGKKYFWKLGIDTIRELETEQGILAAGKEEIYGCIFGRDSLITTLRLLRVHKKSQDPYFLQLAKKVLTNLISLQGKEENIQSGEQRGKMIHEYRPSGHEHLTKREQDAWYLYPDNIMRNFDSVDATPLFLIAAYRYWQASRDDQFLLDYRENIEMALQWILEHGDMDGDGFYDYMRHPQRTAGGLISHSWMDSGESVFHEDEFPVTYPVAPIEVQAYCYLALQLWAIYFTSINTEFSYLLAQKSSTLKYRFNRKFLVRDGDQVFFAAGIDSAGKALTSVRSNMGHCLWAALTAETDGINDCIIENHYIHAVVTRLLEPDMFEPKAGIRTLSKNSSRYDPSSYHNGSIWPHDNSMIIEGMINFGYGQEAQKVRTALLIAMEYFNTPIELFVYDQGEYYREFQSPDGQVSCKKQAWSAASLLVESV
jgi:glycogen debranching enzyme